MSDTPPRHLLPTTRTQVSGHRFMRRRVEHGLIFGDIRMIHDPLAARQRATIFGAVAVAIVAAVMALLAWLRPNADPGDALILRGGSGQLYVRVDGTVHPVTNLASARLIAGAPEEPRRIGDANLLALPRGVPVGIVTAPDVFAPGDAAASAWSACTVAGDGRVAVVAGPGAATLGEGRAVLAEADGRQWVVSGSGRRLLPAADDLAGRAIRRNLGIEATTPVWRPPAQLLSAAAELPPLVLPVPLPEVISSGEESWAREQDGGVYPVTALQRDILLDAGAEHTEMSGAQLAELPDADPRPEVRLPEKPVEWVDPQDETVCVAQERAGAVLPGGVPAPAELSGNATAALFSGLADGAVAVDSGHGLHVVSTEGVAHPVADAGVLDVLGARHVEHVPWEIVSLLPAGAELNQREALTATY